MNVVCIEVYYTVATSGPAVKQTTYDSHTGQYTSLIILVFHKPAVSRKGQSRVLAKWAPDM